MRTSILICTLSVCATGLTGIVPKVSTDHPEGSFASPGVATKPKFRYWLPDASIDPTGFSDDIIQLAKRGAGGTELLNYFGLPTSVTPSNWDIYGYGAPGYSKIVKVALEAHRDAGILFDYAHSANGCVPAKKGNPDVTSLVDSSGYIKTHPTEVPDAQYYVIQAYYAVQPLERELAAWSSDPQTIFQNGSVAVDHFSAVGAKVITDFMGDYVLLDGVKELFQQVGKNLWEDSLEISGDTYWTPGLLDKFKTKYGYSLRPYIPLIVARNGYTTRSPKNIYVLDTEDQGQGILDDFRGLLSSLSKEYTDFIGKWSHDVLGMDFSAQMGYNTPMDMLQTMTDVDVPEAETLSFSNQIDSYLQVAGPANLAGKPVISVELGADWHQAYYQSWEMLLFDAKHAFAGGINQVVIHSATYSHNFTATTWPGYTTHKYDYPGQHSRHQPAWDVGYPEALGYLGRVQWVLQTSIPKVDIIFWDKQLAQNAYPQPLYWFDDLKKAGYTHEYLSPANFVLEKAIVRNKVFAPNAQAARAIIIRGNDTLTPEGVEYLATYAAAGLPIVISGGLPSKYGSGNQAALSKAKAAFQGLLSRINVHQVPLEGLAASLNSIGITPRIQVQSNGSWYSRWRETSKGDIYAWIYNDGADSIGSLIFSTTGTPYYLNAWTGEEELIFEYTTASGSTRLPFALKKHETRIVKFTKTSPLLRHATASSGSVLGFNVQLSGSLIQAKVAHSSSFSSVSTSFGIPQTFRTTGVQPSFTIDNWNLTIEHWGPPDDLYNLDLDAKKENLTVPIVGPSLRSCKDLGFSDISGIGFYNTTFDWNPSLTYSGGGAYLTLPPVSDGIVGILNGKRLPTFDITNPTIDIKSYLRKGKNVLEFKVSSTLKNSLKPIWDNFRTAGGGVALDWNATANLGFGLQHYGLIGEVQIVPYGLIPIL
ncbi:hypothetical protein V492_02598 [Pseudogymnoascus sp. VKM F-4246]|nr:hypothetical protein V492_02598 [Pseudogymnoascus sp. VKM F-4246]